MEHKANAFAIAVCVACCAGGAGTCTNNDLLGESLGCRAYFERSGPLPLSEAPLIYGRQSIPDSHMKWMPRALSKAKPDFPVVFRYTAADEADIDGASRAFQELLHADLHRFGALVVKGLPEVSMEPHTDDPFWPTPPSRLILFVGRPPRSGGQAVLSDSRAVLLQLRQEFPDLLAEFERRSLRYEHFYPDKSGGVASILSWQDAFAQGCADAEGCNATEAAEEALRAMGGGYEWLAGEGLRRWEVVSPVLRHPATAEAAWANQVTAMHCTVFDNHPMYPELNRPPEARKEPCAMHGRMPYHTTYGDGGPIPIEVIHAIRQIQWANAVSFDYATGDVIAIDNYYTMHGRLSFQPPRELYLTLVLP